MKELRQEGKIGQIPDYSPTMKPEFPLLGEAMETSASFEARSAPSPYPTTGVEVRMKEPVQRC